MPAARILVADDEPLIRNLLVRVLRSTHTIVCVEDGQALLDLVRVDDLFDLVLLDVMMPRVDGIEAYRLLHERTPDLARRVVFMTGGATTPEGEWLLDHIHQPRLDKPFQIAELRELVDGLISLTRVTNT